MGILFGTTISAANTQAAAAERTQTPMTGAVGWWVWALYRLRRVFQVGGSLTAAATVEKELSHLAVVFPPAPPEFDKSVVVAAF